MEVLKKINQLNSTPTSEINKNEIVQNQFNIKENVARYLGIILLIVVSIPLSRYISLKIISTFDTKSRNRIYIDLFAAVIRYGIIFISILVSFKIAKINTTAIFGALGIIGLGISLSFQQYMQDFVAGFFLIFFDYFRNGDLIESDDILGRVREFRLFSTTIETQKNNFHEIPNSVLWKNSFRNLSKQKSATLDIKFLVSNKNNLRDVIEFTKKTIRKHTTDKNPTVTLRNADRDDYGASILCYIKVAEDKYIYHLHNLPVQIRLMLQENNFILLDGFNSTDDGPRKNHYVKYQSHAIDPIIRV